MFVTVKGGSCCCVGVISVYEIVFPFSLCLRQDVLIARFLCSTATRNLLARSLAAEIRSLHRIHVSGG